MPRGAHVCTRPGCPVIIPADDPNPRCPADRRQAERQRGTPAQRGYGTAHRQRFRAGVLAKDPTCTCELDDCGHLPGRCLSWSTVADHWPLGRNELVAAGLDPDDPQHGRGLCSRCHNRSTAQRQPGGWHRDAR